MRLGLSEITKPCYKSCFNIQDGTARRASLDVVASLHVRIRSVAVRSFDQADLLLELVPRLAMHGFLDECNQRAHVTPGPLAPGMPCVCVGIAAG